MTDYLYERDENVDDVRTANQRGHEQGLGLRRPETDLGEGNASRHACEDFRGIGSYVQQPVRPGDDNFDEFGDPVVLP